MVMVLTSEDAFETERFALTYIAAHGFLLGASRCVEIANEALRLLARPTERGAVRWRERWYGSDPERGSAIVDEFGNLVAYFGGDEATHKATTAVVAAHNAASNQSVESECTVSDLLAALAQEQTHWPDGDGRTAAIRCGNIGKAIGRALATQPATGRTMGGEDADEGPIADAARRVASWSGNKVQVYNVAKRELAALQNGGE